MKLNHGFKFASPLFALCLLASVALAAFNFPQLTGRVTDQANVISAPAKASIETKLRNLEDKSGIQLVVATVSSLEGGDIESYANGLFRAWKLGMAKKNNGVLFLIAPNERKMRIEVGYGLEGVLTDAVSSVIIRAAVAPRFKAGDFDGGIERGVDAIIETLFERHQRVDEARGAGAHVGHARPARARHPVHIVHVHHDLHVAQRARRRRRADDFPAAGRRFWRWRGRFWRRRRRLRRRRIFRRRRIVGRRRRLGGLVMRVSNEDYRRVAEAIRAAEQKTGAEIVCVLARRSSDYSYVPALWASFAALATPWPLIAFTHLPVREIFAAQIAVFIAAALLFSLSPVHSLLTPRRIKRARAHRAAREQFFTRGVGRTSERRGVLIFASLAERYARIIADVGVAEVVKDEEWRAALDPLLARLREGGIADGYVAAIEETARLLDGRFPPGGKDELPDRLFVM